LHATDEAVAVRGRRGLVAGQVVERELEVIALEQVVDAECPQVVSVLDVAVLLS